MRFNYSLLITFCFAVCIVCLCFCVYQQYATKTRVGIRRGKTGQELKEAAMEPSVEKIFKSRQQSLVFELEYVNMF